MTNRHLAITMGDPAGIGPEIIVKSCARLRDRLASGDLKLLIIGSRRAFDQANRQIAADLDVPQVTADAADWPNLGFLQADTESDRIAPESYGRAYAASFPDGRFEPVPAAGHLPHLEQPARVLDAIHRFAHETARSATN